MLSVWTPNWSITSYSDSKMEMGGSKISRRHDSVMVMVDKLSKVAQFIAVKSTNLASEVAQIFIREIVRLYSVPKKIISDRDVKFTSRFWKELFVGLGTTLDFSTTYHPWTGYVG